jgi:hypothetical protein
MTVNEGGLGSSPAQSLQRADSCLKVVTDDSGCHQVTQGMLWRVQSGFTPGLFPKLAGLQLSRRVSQ